MIILCRIKARNITTISSRLFSDNELTLVTIPNTVMSIEDGAFSDNKLTSVTIPSHTKLIKFDRGQDPFDKNVKIIRK